MQGSHSWSPVLCWVLLGEGPRRERGGSLGLWASGFWGRAWLVRPRRGQAPYVMEILGPQGATSQGADILTHLWGLSLMRVSSSK